MTPLNPELILQLMLHDLVSGVAELYLTLYCVPQQHDDYIRDFITYRILRMSSDLTVNAITHTDKNNNL